ncbi:hypothetical protein MSPP1_002604 [Malassezia sp. CBS 17886]|nr:hypothetical protein MSPP1_002604 [Malassezia sp. CBS 17886]
MSDTRIELGALGGSTRGTSPAPVHGGHAHVIPMRWRRRRRWVVALVFIVVVLACFTLFSDRAPRPMSMRVPRPWGNFFAPVDAEIYALTRDIPGAEPGARDAAASGDGRSVEDNGHHGEPYPRRQDALVLLLRQLRDPAFNADTSVWGEWGSWFASEVPALPPNAHVQFLEQLRRQDNGSLADARLYLEHPTTWLMRHQDAVPLTVFSKSYCPYSRKAKALLTQLGAHFTAYEVDLRADQTLLQRVLFELTGLRTYPKVLAGAQLLGGSDRLGALQSDGLLRGILRSVGALD